MHFKHFQRSMRAFLLDIINKKCTPQPELKFIVDTRLEFITRELIIMQKIYECGSRLVCMFPLHKFEVFIASIYLIMIAQCVAAVPSVLLFLLYTLNDKKIWSIVELSFSLLLLLLYFF